MSEHAQGQDLVWSDTFAETVERFEGQRPTDVLERELLAHFLERPAEFAAAVEKVADRLAKRKISSPWPILKRELENAAQRDTITTTDHRERDKAIHLVERWIRNCGLYMPTETDLLDEVFGTTGRLRQWGDDHELRARIVQLWNDEQPRAVKADPEWYARNAAQTTLAAADADLT